MMASQKTTRLADLLAKHEPAVLNDWVRGQQAATTQRKDLISAADLRRESAEFLGLFIKAADSNNLTDITAPEWSAAREFLAGVSRSRALAGFSPSETATFVFSLKEPLFSRIRQEAGDDAGALADQTWEVTVLLDQLGLATTETYQKSREDVIKRQQMELLELSTPVVKLWEGIVLVPLIGTLDSSRTEVVMEALLQAIVTTGSGFAIIDITGVPAVDTLVAQHLLKTATAARLMGAQCIVSGIRPQIAQTMVHLGVEFGDIVTKAALADALAYAFARMGKSVTNQAARA